MVVPYPCHLRSTGSSIREGFHVCRETDELAWSETLSASVGPSAEPRHHAATANVGSDLHRLGATWDESFAKFGAAALRGGIVRCVFRGMAFGHYQFDGAACVSCVGSAALYGISGQSDLEQHVHIGVSFRCDGTEHRCRAGEGSLGHTQSRVRVGTATTTSSVRTAFRESGAAATYRG